MEFYKRCYYRKEYFAHHPPEFRPDHFGYFFRCSHVGALRMFRTGGIEWDTTDFLFRFVDHRVHAERIIFRCRE